MRFYLGRNNYLTTEPVQLIVTLSDNQPILGATVTVEAEPPFQAAQAIRSSEWIEVNGDTVPDPSKVTEIKAAYPQAPIRITLYDDGLHSDGLANDGVYANTFGGTFNAGTWVFSASASGISNMGEAFARYAEVSTYIAENPSPNLHRIYLPVVTRNYDPLLQYFDDFSDPSSGWYIYDRGNIRWSYQEGEYEILVRNAHWWAGASAPISGIDNYSIEADMRRYIGATSIYGLIFGLVDWDHFYWFVVNPESQSYSVWKRDPNNWVPIVEWTFSSHINPSDASNHLKVERYGSQIVVYANGHLLATTSDDTYTGTLRVGLYVENIGDVTPVAVRFDNFEVRRLQTAIARSDTPMLQGEVSAGGGSLSVQYP